MKCPYCNTENEERVCRKCHAEIPVPETAPVERKPEREKRETKERRK